MKDNFAIEKVLYLIIIWRVHCDSPKSVQRLNIKERLRDERKTYVKTNILFFKVYCYGHLVFVATAFKM